MEDEKQVENVTATADEEGWDRGNQTKLFCKILLCI